ncbi:hypothetical protein JB92DRAFT_3110681 [Gautieria morchelliformis]|nr:hypothetical protein JB92DRAFT_3110681 [Gautieria morchelliformis]
MDGSNVLDPGFLERMNTLLASAEVPVFFFEGDEHSKQVAKNLHVVFTMNPPENGLASRAATSPALFNRAFQTGLAIGTIKLSISWNAATITTT